VTTQVPGIRTNQRQRTHTAIVDAARALVLSGAEVTMPAVAKAALVSEATAYRYFPDLVSLLREALEGTWPEPAEALKPVAGTADPVERIGFATEFMLREVLARQGAVRAMISASALRPEVADKARPGHRFGLIDHALAPLDQAPDVIAPAVLVQLKQDLAIIVSAEALFVFTDMCGFSPDKAVKRTARIARTVTAAAIRGVAAE
jgi:AcrR family transcriptional regulator